MARNEHDSVNANDTQWLQASDPGGAETCLRALGWLRDKEAVIEIVSAGEGNMNLTLRVVTSERSLVLKQSRPWVEKYSQIPAPVERALVEAAFYREVSSNRAVAGMMPELLACDDERFLILLQDLGPGADLSSHYSDGNLVPIEQLGRLARYLGALHAIPFMSSSNVATFSNRAMRRLNHEHVFEVPFNHANGVAVDEFEPGLSQVAAELCADDALLDRVAGLGQRYLADGDTLLHGDFFLGSWLETQRPPGLWVIDPEFCFAGDAEFDVAVALAHLILARQPFEVVEAWLAQCRDTHLNRLDEELIARFAACEILRRLLGVAQLPLAPSTGWRAERVRRAAATLRTGGWLDLV